MSLEQQLDEAFEDPNLKQNKYYIMRTSQSVSSIEPSPWLKSLPKRIEEILKARAVAPIPPPTISADDPLPDEDKFAHDYSYDWKRSLKHVMRTYKWDPSNERKGVNFRTHSENALRDILSLLQQLQIDKSEVGLV